MNAGDIMHRPVITASPTSSIRDIAGVLLMEGFSGLPVADEKGDVLGVVTELDLIRAFMEKKSLDATTAEEIMTRDVKSVDVQTPVNLVMEVLETQHFIRVPVTESGKLVGVISRRDIIKAMVQPKFRRF